MIHRLSKTSVGLLVLFASNTVYATGDCCFTDDKDGDGDLDCMSANAGECAFAGGQHFPGYTCTINQPGLDPPRGDICSDKLGPGYLECFDTPFRSCKIHDVFDGPAVTASGLVGLGLLLAVAITLKFGRRRAGTA